MKEYLIDMGLKNRMRIPRIISLLMMMVVQLERELKKESVVSRKLLCKRPATSSVLALIMTNSKDTKTSMMMKTKIRILFGTF